MADNYAAAGYSSSQIGLGQKPAVIVVDLQLAFTDPRFPIGNLPMIHAATERTAELLKVARRHNVPVASCYTAYGSQADMPHWKVKAVREEFFYGHPCTAMDPRVHEPGYDFVFCKSAPSIFFLTPLVTFLTKQRVDTVIVTGCTTSGCVRATVADAFSLGFKVVVPEECVYDRGEVSHAINLFDMQSKYGDVVSSQEVIAYLKGIEPWR